MVFRPLGQQQILHHGGYTLASTTDTHDIDDDSTDEDPDDDSEPEQKGVQQRPAAVSATGAVASQSKTPQNSVTQQKAARPPPWAALVSMAIALCFVAGTVASIFASRARRENVGRGPWERQWPDGPALLGEEAHPSRTHHEGGGGREDGPAGGGGAAGDGREHKHASEYGGVTEKEPVETQGPQGLAVGGGAHRSSERDDRDDDGGSARAGGSGAAGDGREHEHASKNEGGTEKETVETQRPQGMGGDSNRSPERDERDDDGGSARAGGGGAAGDGREHEQARDHRSGERGGAGCVVADAIEKLTHTPCPRRLVRGKCSECACISRCGECQGPAVCLACQSPYFFNSSVAQAVLPEGGPEYRGGRCVFPCPSAPPVFPGMPRTAIDWNGIEWPQACFSDAEDYHFFVIGDWGGELQDDGTPRPAHFSNARAKLDAIDDHAQLLVAARMREVAKISRPRFVVNVGDNFYPGGLAGHCNAMSGAAAFSSIQFALAFEKVYTGEGLDTAEWWGVLGNHDYGGWKYTSAWDQNIFYTWHAANSRWLTPALYWSRRVQFPDFAADFYFIDTNVLDVGPPDSNPAHNICSFAHNLVSDGLECGVTNLTSPSTCPGFFHTLFAEQRDWLREGLTRSTAEWQIVVTHFPPTWGGIVSETLSQLSAEYGIDLILSGHVHFQQVNAGAAAFAGTPWIVSGGGGGIVSEGVPVADGQDDQYGFMDLTISKEQILVEAHSHGGVNGRRIVRSTTRIRPRSRASEYADM